MSADAALHVGDQIEAIFDDRRFVCWCWEGAEGEKTKVPYEPGTQRKASHAAGHLSPEDQHRLSKLHHRLGGRELSSLLPWGRNSKPRSKWRG